MVYSCFVDEIQCEEVYEMDLERAKNMVDILEEKKLELQEKRDELNQQMKTLVELIGGTPIPEGMEGEQEIKRIIDQLNGEFSSLTETLDKQLKELEEEIGLANL